MRVLIVKVSSLGDVIHTLPAVTDAYRAKRGLTFDWVVEEGFTEIPRWHPAVDKVIPVAFRRWRKNLFKTWRSGEFSSFKKNLQEHHYDLRCPQRLARARRALPAAKFPAPGS